MIVYQLLCAYLFAQVDCMNAIRYFRNFCFGNICFSCKRFYKGRVYCGGCHFIFCTYIIQKILCQFFCKVFMFAFFKI